MGSGAHGLSSCGAQAELLPGMWNLPRLKSVSLAVAGRFLPTRPLGKSQIFFSVKWFHFLRIYSKRQNSWIMKVKVAQSCLTLCDPMDYTVHGILQARILEWVAFPFSRVSSQSRNRTRVSWIEGGFFINWAIREAGSYVGQCLLSHVFFDHSHSNGHVVLICISLATSGDDHPFTYLLPFQISSLKKCVFKPFGHFAIALFGSLFLLLICMSYLYIFR